MEEQNLEQVVEQTEQTAETETKKPKPRRRSHKPFPKMQEKKYKFFGLIRPIRKG